MEVIRALAIIADHYGTSMLVGDECARISRDIALDKGCTLEEVEAAKTWDDVAKMIEAKEIGAMR